MSAQVVGGVIGAIGSIFGGNKKKSNLRQAARETEELAADNASLIRDSAGREVRRATFQNKFVEGGALASAAAAGVVGGSVASYISALEEFNVNNVQEISEAGEAQAQLTEKQGEFQARQLRRDGSAAQVAGIFGALGSISSSFGGG